MAELGSILPIAGAQYHWTHIMAPDSTKKFITWMQGRVLCHLDELRQNH